VNPGEVVILILDHGEALVYAFFGAILGGAIPSIMPFLTEKLSPEQYRAALEALFEITTPAAVITNTTFAGEVALASSRFKPREVLLSDPGPPEQNPEPGLAASLASLLCFQASSGQRMRSSCYNTHRAQPGCKKASPFPTEPYLTR
jgi:acyl-CoA synthetase (AMP-forming)/AMP-acid ligase II